jgi:hypothetical protein
MLHLPPSNFTVPRRMLGLKPQSPNFQSLRSPGIDYNYVAWGRTSNSVFITARQAGNRFRSLKGFEFRAQDCCDFGIDTVVRRSNHSAKAHASTDSARSHPHHSARQDIK